MKKEKVTSIYSNEDLKNKLVAYKLNAVTKVLISVSGVALCSLNIIEPATPMFVGLIAGPTLIATGASGAIKSLEGYKDTKKELGNIEKVKIR